VDDRRPRFLHFAAMVAASEAAAREIARTLIEAVELRSEAALVVAGGSTPRPIYALLADAEAVPRVPWQRVHVFWGDERCVAPDDENSNYAMVRAALLDRIAIPPDNVHRVCGELPPAAAAARYEAELRRRFGGGRPPVFDCIMLGMGADGHTASLFPGDPLAEETERWVGGAEGRRASPAVPRVSLTLPVLNAARKIVFIVSGEAKRRVVRDIEERAEGSERYPAARVGAADAALWFVAESEPGP
jgi:6-phosphogluconolactonase